MVKKKWLNFLLWTGVEILVVEVNKQKAAQHVLGQKQGQKRIPPHMQMGNKEKSKYLRFNALFYTKLNQLKEISSFIFNAFRLLLYHHTSLCICKMSFEDYDRPKLRKRTKYNPTG